MIKAKYFQEILLYSEMNTLDLKVFLIDIQNYSSFN